MALEHNWYKGSLNGSIDMGNIDITCALKIFEDYNQNLKEKYDTHKQAIEASLFGFSLDNCTFLEISIDKANSYRVKFECSIPKSFLFLKWNGLYHREYFINSKSSVTHIIQTLFTKEILSFQKHFDELNFKQVIQH